MLKQLNKGDKFSQSLTIDGEARLVQACFTAKPDAESQSRYVLDIEFNFSQCTMEEILRLASQQFRVMTQAAWRKDKDRFNDGAWENRSVNVADVLRTRSAAADPVTKASTFLDNMSDAQRAEFFKRNGLVDAIDDDNEVDAIDVDQ